MWENMVERGRPQMKYGTCALHAGYVRLQIHSRCVIFVAFPQQQWLHERASMLHYTQITWLVSINPLTPELNPSAQRGAHHVTRLNTPIHTMLSTAPQLSISQEELGTLPEDGNVMPKHVGATIHK
jgi:hypothetical protein